MVQIGIGGGTINVAFTLNVAQTVAGAVVTISLPWTAYNGVLKGTASFQISVLPNCIRFENKKLSYAQLSGSYVWYLNSSGYSYFTGNVSVPWSEVLAQNYAVGVTLSPTNAQGHHPLVAHTGTMGNAVAGTLLGNDSDSWADAGQWNGPNGWIDSNDQGTVISAWAQLCLATATVQMSYSPNAWDTVLGGLIRAYPVDADTHQG
jgi:hypothetical protein